MTSLRKRFGQRVKQLRQATGLSQEAFADRCGFARSYMSRIERGAANPSLDAVQVLADALAVEVAKLFQEDSGNDIPGVILVPFADDGTCFHPGLRRPRAKTYGVGDKGAGNTMRFKDFNDALNYLKAQRTANKPAKWWRPDGNGGWGLVIAVRWAALPNDKATQ